MGGGGAFTVMTILAKVHVYATTTQNVSHDTSTPLTFNTNDTTNYADTAAFHSTSVNPTRVTIPTGQGGGYLVIGVSFIATAPAADCNINLTKNGGAGLPVAKESQQPSGQGTYMHLVGVCVLADADYVELVAYADNLGAGTFAFGNATFADAQSALFMLRLW